MNADPSQCPHIVGFDPAAGAQASDPWEGFRQSREQTPVFFMPDHGMWVISRYEDVREALRDTRTFSSVGHIALPSVPADYRDELDFFPGSIQLNGMDPPMHTPLRRLAQKAFTPATAKTRETEFRELANRLIDEFIAAGTGDLVTHYASIFPLFTSASMLGVTPTSELARELRQWATDVIKLSVDPVTDEELDEIAVRAIEFDGFITNLIAERRAEPGEDVVSMLIAARSDDGSEALTEGELTALVIQTLVGGIDTTGGLIARMLYTLLGDRENWETVVEDPAHHSAEVVEETLRLYGSIRAVGRTTTRDVEVAGTTIPKGSFVLLHIGSASRDRAVFEDAEEFKLKRPMGEMKQQLGLGRGTHFCLGAAFARLAGRIALEEIARRIPDLRLASLDQSDTNESLFVVGLKKLDAEWEARNPVRA